MEVINYTDMLSVHFTGNYNGTSHEKSMKLFAQGYDNCLIHKDDLHVLKEALEEHADRLMYINPRLKRSVIEVKTQDCQRYCMTRAWFTINGNPLYVIRLVPAMLKRDAGDQREGIKMRPWGVLPTQSDEQKKVTKTN